MENCKNQGKSQGKVREKSGNFEVNYEWQPCMHTFRFMRLTGLPFWWICNRKLLLLAQALIIKSNHFCFISFLACNSSCNVRNGNL